jgi:hypothetical protein
MGVTDRRGGQARTERCGSEKAGFGQSGKEHFVSSAPEIRELKPRSLTGRERSLVEALRHFIDANDHPVAGVAQRLGSELYHAS